MGLYNDGNAQTSIVDSAYKIDIEKPGTEPWSIQLTQSNITLENGKAYEFSFELSASIERTVEVSVSRNGGDWVSYSGRDTLKISPASGMFKKMFIMKHATDSGARVEFNCGKGAGVITLKSVKLSLFTEKMLEVDGPANGTVLYAGTPYTIGWSAVNITDTLTIQFSENGGSDWVTIGKTHPDTTSFGWIPAAHYSPWCKVRVVSSGSPELVASTEGFFEVAPSIELVKNGGFSTSDANWQLGVNQGVAEHEINSFGGYQINVLERGTENWHIQLTQGGIVLENKRTYRFSFSGYSEMSSVVDVNIGMSQEPYSSYIDTLSRFVSLSPTSKRFMLVFTMTAPTDSNARFEINCGKATGKLVFDEISIVPEYIAPLKDRSNSHAPIVVSGKPPEFSRLVTVSSYAPRFTRYENVLVFDCKGRIVSGKSVAGITGRRQAVASGVYFTKSTGTKNGVLSRQR